MEHTAKFFVGQVVHHQKFDYRGVVFDVDATFQGTSTSRAESSQRTLAPSIPAPYFEILK